MAKLNTVDITNAPQRILLYGPPKSGKSVAAGLLAKEYEVIYIDLENAASALINNVPAQFHSKIDYIGLKDSQDNPVATDLLPTILEGTKIRFCALHSKKLCLVCRNDPAAVYNEVELKNCKTETVVVIDSFTQLTDSVIGKVTEDLSVDDKLQFDHWGEVARRLHRLLSALQVANYHVVAISHEQVVVLPDKTEKLVPTLGSRNSSKSVGRYFDHLVRMSVRNKDFKSYSAQGSQVNALVGSRSNLDMDADPTLTLVDLLKGKVGKATPINNVATKVDTAAILGKPNRLLSGK